MKKSLYFIIFFSLFFTQASFSLTRGDVKIIEARENIQYLGQKIATDYFLLYTRPHDQVLHHKFRENIVQLENNIQKISDTTQNSITLNILRFYYYRLGVIKNLIQERPSVINASELLYASEYFLEGARSIANQHQYKSTKEEEMLVACKEVRYLVESVSKYYMAFQIGLKKPQYDQKRFEAIEDINHHLKIIQQYRYPEKLALHLQKIKTIWKHNEDFFLKIEKATFPNLLLSANTEIKELLSQLEKHHKQNL